MATIAELKRKIRALQKKQEELSKQEYALQDEVTEMERSKWLGKVKKNIHVGDIRMVNEGITGYHCDAITIYEILNVSEHVHKCKRNGIPTSYTSYSILVREFAIHCYDGDRISRIETKGCFDAETLLKAKKISKETFDEFKTTVFLDPDSYDTSKWNPENKEAN